LIGKTVIYIYVCRQCHTQFMQIRADDNSTTCTFTTGKSDVLMEHP